jgi:hypothetical protein
MGGTQALVWLHRGAMITTLAIACSDGENSTTPSSDAGVSDGAQEAASCPAKASTCPSPCAPVEVAAVDDTNECLTAPSVVGCWGGTGGATHLAGCIKDAATGTKYLTPTTSYIKELVKSGEWELCTTSASQPCP